MAGSDKTLGISGVEQTVAAPVSGVEPTLGAALPAPDAENLPHVEDRHYARGPEIARGGMGRIIEARDLRLGRTVALKELIDKDAGFAARFEREALITARLQHPAIVAIYEAGRWESGEIFYAMKRVSGRSLDKVIADATTLEQRLGLIPNLMAVFDALAYAHGERVIHRDLKPANVLVGKHGETVVIDWGLAKNLDDGAEIALTAKEAAPGATITGAVMGTPAYMPPEQARGHRVDQTADVYALGAMLYHVLGGRQPFGTTSAEATIKAVLAGPPRPLRELEPHVPEDLAAIVDKAMEALPAERYPTANELAQDLRRFQTGQLVGAHAYSPKDLIYRWLRRHRAAVSVAAVMLVLSGVALAVAFRSVVVARDRANEERTIAEARADELVLRRARDLLGSDPTASLAWLAQYPKTGPERDEAALIAAEASSLGIAKHVLAGHTRDVRDVAVSPDAKWIASAGADGDVRLWDATTGAGRSLLHGDVAALRLQFAGTGKFLAATTVDGKVHVWNAITWEALPVLGAGNAAIRALAWSPDGRWLVAAGDDHQVRVWSTPSFGVVDVFDAGDDVFEVAFAPDGHTLAAAGRVHEVRAWQLPRGTRRTFGPIGDGTLGVKFSPDGTQLAAACRDGKTYIWNVATGESVRTLDDGRLVRTIAFSPTGTTIATAGEGTDIHLWTVATGDSQTLTGHTGAVVDLAFTADGSLISASLDHTLAIWDVASGSRRSLAGHHDMVNRFSLARDGSLVVSAGKDHAIRVWPLRRETSYVLALPNQVANDIAFAPSGNELVSAWRDGRVIRWTPGHPLVDKLDACKSAGAPRRVAYSPDGKTVAWAGGERDVHLCDETGLHTLTGNASETFTLAYAPDGRLVTGGIDKTVRVWDVATGENRILYTHGGGVWTLAVSPDGKHFASAGFDKLLAIGDLDSTAPPRVRAGHRDAINAVVFSRDGKRVATASDDETARSWSTDGEQVAAYDLQRTAATLDITPDGALVTGTHDGSVRLLEAGRPARILARHRGTVASVAVSPDGRFVASGGQDGTVWLADLQRDAARVFVTDGPIRRVTFSADGKRFGAAGTSVHVWAVDGGPMTTAVTTAVVRDDGEIATP